MNVSRTKVDVGFVLATGRDLLIDESILLPASDAVSFPETVATRLTLRRAGSILEIVGTVDASAHGHCARCLDPVVVPLHLDIEERLDPAADRGVPLGETNVLAGDELDLADFVRQTVDSALPLVLRCAADCEGLCVTCGEKRDDRSLCSHPEN